MILDRTSDIKKTDSQNGYPFLFNLFYKYFLKNGTNLATAASTAFGWSYKS